MKKVGIMLLLGIFQSIYGVTSTTGEVDIEFMIKVEEPTSLKKIADIDFGNLLIGSTGVQQEKIKGALSITTLDGVMSNMKLKFSKKKGIQLNWIDTTPSTPSTGKKRTIDNVELIPVGYTFDSSNSIVIIGVNTVPKIVEIGATFQAGGISGNLISTQELGKYKGSIRITGVKI